MAELWRPSEHEPLAGEEWSEERAEEAIAAIVADAESAFDGVRWPWHPRDGDEDGRWSVYMGAAGVIWALHDLGATGWEDAAVALIDHYRAEPDMPEFASAPSYWAGESGIGLVAFRLTGDAGIADRVHELVLANLDSPANEVMWGTPGTLLVAEAMLEWTAGEQRWGRVGDERGARARGSRRRTLDATDLRQGVPVPRAGARLCRERQGPLRQPRAGPADRLRALSPA